jgi:predicted dehydrogenase
MLCIWQLLTESYQSARQLAAAVDRQAVKVGINYQRRYDVGYHTLIQAMQSGNLGRLRYARINVPWNRDWDYFANSVWHQKKVLAGGGTLITQASHYIDIVLQACLPAAPLECVGFTDRLQYDGRIEVEDFAMGIIRMSDGAYIEVCSSMDAVPARPVQIELYGSKGTLIHTDQGEQLDFLGEIEVVREVPPFAGADSLERSLEAFRAWIEENVPYWTPISSALPVLACVDGLYRASAERRVVGLK